MIIKKNPILLLLLLILQINFLNAAQELDDFWKAWFEEVDPIMTEAERSVFKNLPTEEDRKRFRNLFWQVRDNTPGTSENEFMVEYYLRKRYVDTRLGGAHSDQGRIYLIMGKPVEVKNYAGLEKVVDCELWIYRAEGRSGLPPLMYLLFYRRDNIGDYKLYYPGPHSSLDILSTRYNRDRISNIRAYKIIRSSFPQLARATLSVIPDEASVTFAGGINSSVRVIGQIHTLPEKEVEKHYLKNFGYPAGTVDVSYSTKQILGKAMIFLTERQGVKFINYALMPDRIQTSKTDDGHETAWLVFHLRIEDKNGKTVYQRENEIRLRLDEAKKKAMLERKFIFNDFAPVIEGEFQIRLTCSNKTSEEFFVHEQKVVVNDHTLPIVVGYEVKETKPDSIIPFSLDPYKVLLDPRSLFSFKDSIEGLILSDESPEIFLMKKNGEGPMKKVQNVSREGGLVIFRQLLEGFKPGFYDLIVKRNGAEVFRWSFSVLSFEVAKPLEFERVEPLSFQESLPFIIGQEYLNSGQAGKALESFQQLPENLWNNSTLPVIARAHYFEKDYARVVELLERDTIEKNYPVLLLLGNASLEIKKLDRAAIYFEEIRKYGDTAEVNKILGAIYHTMGERSKAKVYWDRAKKLEKESTIKNP